MKNPTRRELLTSGVVVASAATAGCVSRLPGFGDDGGLADSQQTNLGVEPVVETTSQYAADWQNTSWVSGTTLANTPEQSWRVPVEDYEGIRQGGTGTGTTAYFFTNDQRVIRVDAETGDETAEHPIGIQSSTTPITHNNRVFIMGEVDSSGFAGMVTMLDRDMEQRTWSGYTEITPTSKLTSYLSQSYVGTELGQLYCFNNQDGESEWTTVIDANTPVIHAPVVDRNNVYATTESQLVSLTRDSGEESWNTTLSEEPITNPILYGSHILIVGTTTITAYDAETGDRKWDVTRQSPDASVAVTASNDSLITYRVTGDETTLVEYSIETGDILETETLPGVISAPPVVANALVYVPQENGLLAWDTLNNNVQWTHETPDPITHQPIVTAENVVLQTDSDLLAIE